ncbi:MAG: hypothetical protein ACI9VR_001816 [Cognaticolwellia sp.]
MSSVELGLRRAFLGLVCASALGACTELALAGHFESNVQLVPFGLAALGMVCAVVVWLSPSKNALRALQGAMSVVAAGGLFGIWEHLEHNYAFEAEIRPAASTIELVTQAVFGASPALAPGMFLIMAAMGFAAAWRHPTGIGEAAP